jgi:phosphoribosylformylglycinamidine synthase
VHINRLLENPRLALDYQILCIPGGFSYGDDIAAGRILANQIRHHLHQALADFKAADKLILGVCNGFQVLIKSGVLIPDDDSGRPLATLTWNDSGKFEARWVRLSVTAEGCVFLRGAKTFELPVAHAEGKFVVRDQATLDRLEAQGRLALRYVGPDPGGAVLYPLNPNGSMANVAGMCDETGRVLGLMPHPERHVDPTHHPRWTRETREEKGEGLLVFENAVNYFA